MIAALDALSVSATVVARIRAELPDTEVMVAATHTHGSGALVRCGEVEADNAYQDRVVVAVVSAATDAIARMRPAEVATARAMQTSLPHNRRVVQRDGTVHTHGTFAEPDALWIEGPVDPELFAALGLAVKQAAYPWRALVVGLANGMVGYVPTREAFNRGGYETTLSTVSKLAPEAGEQLVRAAASLTPDYTRSR